MSKRDPLNLMGNIYQPNNNLNSVPKVHNYQCEICQWPAPSFSVLSEHQFFLHEFPQIKPISPIHSSPTSPDENDTSNIDKNDILEQSAQTISSIQELDPKEVWQNKCNKCGACFTRNNNLKRHIMKSCHKNPNSEYSRKKAGGIKCLFCDKLFSNTSNMKQHVRNNH